MTECKGDDSAFPTVEPNFDCRVTPGLTKREYFAAKALQGLLINLYSSDMPWEAWPVEAVRMADLLIAALDRKAGE
jgi:hypothetical protein